MHIRLDTDRPDPENREFKHPDSVGWTEAHRAEILAALYTILLGNPALKTAHDAPSKTRFKMWWRLIGSAVEHAAGLIGHEIDFEKIFREHEETEDEDSVTLADALSAMAKEWPGGFHATDVAEVFNGFDNKLAPTLREFLYPGFPESNHVSVRSVGKRLSKHKDCPVKLGDYILSLKVEEDTMSGQAKGSMTYKIKIMKDGKEAAKAWQAVQQAVGGRAHSIGKRSS